MRLDRISVFMLILLIGSAGAIGYHYIPKDARLSLAGASAAEGETPELVDEGPEADEDLKLSSAEQCLVYTDPGDPRAPAGATGYHRDELQQLAVEDPAKVTAFVNQCPAFARAAKDPAVADRIQYQVARFQDVLERSDDYLTTLEGIAPRYPAAAYALGLALRNSPSASDVNSTQFGRAYDMLKAALDGGDQRARRPLIEMAQELYPLDGFNLPTLIAALQTGRLDLIPDTESARMAVNSLWVGYHKRCEAWEIMQISPADQAAIGNYVVKIQAYRGLKLISELPKMGNTVQNWVSNLGNISFEQMLKDFNNGAAYPAQIMFILDTAATRDGSQAYDKFNCSGRRANRLVVNMLRLFNERQKSSPTPSDGRDMQVLSAQPDIATLI